MDKGTKIRELGEMLARKTAQLAKVMRVAEAAAGDLQKYVVLTSTDKGARDVVLNVRRLHHANCKDTDKGCDYDRGFVAWIAHSFGIKADSLDLPKVRVMMQQFEAMQKTAAGSSAGGSNVTLGALPSVGDATIISAKPKQQVKTKTHVFKGPPNDRRLVQPGSKEAKGDVAPPVEDQDGRPADAAGSAPDA